MQRSSSIEAPKVDVCEQAQVPVFVVVMDPMAFLLPCLLMPVVKADL
jgi:hypothetical protein